MTVDAVYATLRDARVFHVAAMLSSIPAMTVVFIIDGFLLWMGTVRRVRWAMAAPLIVVSVCVVIAAFITADRLRDRVYQHSVALEECVHHRPLCDAIF